MFRSLSRVATSTPSLSMGRLPAGTKSLLSNQSSLATDTVRRRQPTIRTIRSVQLSTTATATTSNLVAFSPSALSSWQGDTNANPTTGRNVAWWYFAAGATVTTVASAMGTNDSVTLCDKSHNFPAHNNNNNDDEDDEVEEDPYDNLPEQDEPTHCSICLTYRQGPCRPYWRKVEACTKDHELKKKPDQDNDTNQSNDDNNSDSTRKSSSKDNNDDEEEEPLEDPPCLKYMLPWIDCATGYRNLYALIELDTNYTMGIAELENEATVQACWAPSHEPTIDWTPWQEYVATHPQWKLPKRSTTTKNNNKKNSPNANDEHVSLWKTVGTDRDPEMVDILASVPSQQGQGILECAYAVDQDGHVLGFSYGTKPSEVAAKSSTDHDEDSDKSTSTEVELKIRLLPLHTRSITVAAAYTQPAKEGAKEIDPLESHIFKSRPFSLKKMSTSRKQ